MVTWIYLEPHMPRLRLSSLSSLTAQYSTGMYSAAQRSVAQASTAQHSAAQNRALFSPPFHRSSLVDHSPSVITSGLHSMHPTHHGARGISHRPVPPSAGCSSTGVYATGQGPATCHCRRRLLAPSHPMGTPTSRYTQTSTGLLFTAA